MYLAAIKAFVKLFHPIELFKGGHLISKRDKRVIRNKQFKQAGGARISLTSAMYLIRTFLSGA